MLESILSEDIELNAVVAYQPSRSRKRIPQIVVLHLTDKACKAADLFGVRLSKEHVNFFPGLRFDPSGSQRTGLYQTSRNNGLD